MKKMLAMLLAALMLLSMTAMAETTAPAEATALMMTIDHVVYSVYSDGVTATRDLDGFSAMAALDATKDLELTLATYNGEEALSFLVAKLADGKLHLASNAAEETYAIDIPEAAAATVDQLPGLVKAALPALVGMKLPMINAVKLPKVDLSAVMSMFGSQPTVENGVTTTPFTVPSTVIDMLIQQLSTSLKAAAAQNQSLAMVSQLVESFKQSGMSISLGGSLVDTADQQTCEVGVYISTAEQAAEAPTLVLTTTSVENSFSLDVSMPNDDSMYKVGGVAFASDPAANTMRLSMDAMGMVSTTVDCAQKDNQQSITVNYSMFGSEYTAVTTYGVDAEGKQFTNSTGTIGNLTVTANATGELQEDGSYAGTLEYVLDDGYTKKTYTADYYQVLGTYDSGYNMPATIVPITEMDGTKAQAAVKPLIDYFNTTFADNAA